MSRFENMNLGMLRTNIAQMEERVHDAAVGEVYRGWVPKVGLNAAYMRARAIYARRTGDIREAERLEETWDGFKQRIESGQQEKWQQIREYSPAGKAIADFVELLGRFRF